MPIIMYDFGEVVATTLCKSSLDQFVSDESARSFFYYGSQLSGGSSLLFWSVIKLLGNVCESVP